MKKIILLSFLLFTFLTSFSQSYLGKVTKKVNFREGAGTDYPVISSLTIGTQVFIVSLETENDFYNIIDIATDKEGYIHKSFVKVGQEIKKNESGMFSPNGQIDNNNPENMTSSLSPPIKRLGRFADCLICVKRKDMAIPCPHLCYFLA